MVMENLVEFVNSHILGNWNFLIKLGIGAGIVVIVYILYLIIRGIFYARTFRDVRKILKVLGRIDDKLDILVKKKRKK